MTSLDHLMPQADETVRCADFARTIALDPGGTAIRADRVVLVETGLPWPKPIFDHPTLREIDPLFKEARRVTRLLGCQVPVEDDDMAATQVWVFDRLDHYTRERRFELGSPNELLELASCLAQETHGSEATSAEAPNPVLDGPMDAPALLVCTQGSHDICCGADGERFAQAAEAMDVPGMRVFRVSHTGGHRFSPTAMTLPDGRMWAYLVPELLQQILDGNAALSDAANGEGADNVGRFTDLAPYCRGWWGAERGSAQVAERAVFAEVGPNFDQMPRTCTEIEPSIYRVEAERTVDGTVKTTRWTVEVELVREVPTIACRKPGGLPNKVGREYQAVIRDVT